ncbi:MAG: acyl-CoA dehydrogenase [Ilumatobacter sp.]|jgi:acyl-CoA dehydrogenase
MKTATNGSSTDRWSISNARRASFAILVGCPEHRPEIPQAANSAFLVDLPQEGWNDVRGFETMHSGTGHSEILITDLRVHKNQMLGGRDEDYLLGQYRLGSVRRWRRRSPSHAHYSAHHRRIHR